MKAWKITEPGQIGLTTSPGVAAGKGCVKIKIGQCLLSRPDIQVYLGSPEAKLPVVPGGSCCGMVVEVGEEVTELERGDRVYVGPRRYCGVCGECKAGRQGSCENAEYYGITCDGFMRDFAVVRACDCIKIPERIDNDEAVFLDYIATAVQVMSALDVRKGEHLAISGASAIGIILGQVALYYQAIPILVDVNADYLQKAYEMGVYYTVNAVECDPKSKIFHITGGRMAECAAHIASGNVPISQSVNFAGKSGRLAVVGRYGCNNSLDCSLLPVIENNLTILGVTGGAKNAQIAMNMLANKAVTVQSLITNRVGFEDIPEVFAAATTKTDEHLKTIIKIS